MEYLEIKPDARAMAVAAGRKEIGYLHHGNFQFQIPQIFIPSWYFYFTRTSMNDMNPPSNVLGLITRLLEVMGVDACFARFVMFSTFHL